MSTSGGSRDASVEPVQRFGEGCRAELLGSTPYHSRPQGGGNSVHSCTQVTRRRASRGRSVRAIVPLKSCSVSCIFTSATSSEYLYQTHLSIQFNFPQLDSPSSQIGFNAFPIQSTSDELANRLCEQEREQPSLDVAWEGRQW